MKTEDPERYAEWRIEDVIPMTREDHAVIHHKGEVMSDEQKAVLSETRFGHNNPFYGKHHSEEARLKIGEAHKGNHHRLGKHMTSETKAKISASSVGKQKSAETKNKISNTLKGHVLSEETRAKISATLKQRHTVEAQL